MKGYIYRHISPSGKSYIGQTIKSVEDRWRGGNGYLDSRSKYRAIGKAIQKYGWDNFTHEILETVEAGTKEELIQKLNQLEQNYILEYSTIIPNGYNMNTGGKKFVMLEETRLKLIEARKRQAPFTEEDKKKMGDSHRGSSWFNNGEINVFRKECPEGFVKGRIQSTIQKLREASKGNTSHLGFKHSERVKDLISQKSIEQFRTSKPGNAVWLRCKIDGKEFHSKVDAARFYGLTNRTLYKANLVYISGPGGNEVKPLVNRRVKNNGLFRW